MPRILLVGAGPAGISAALWCHNLGLRIRWLEASDRLGGNLHLIRHPIEDLAGVVGLDGAALAARLAGQLAALDLSPEFGARVERITDGRSGRVRVTSSGRSGDHVESYDRVLLATGSVRRRLPAFDRLPARARIGSSRDGVERFVGGRIAIVGGGDGAYDNALRLAQAGVDALVLQRRATPRARWAFVRAAAAEPRIEVRTEAELVDVHLAPDDRLASVEIIERGVRHHLPADGLMIRIGEQAVYPGLPDGADRDDGYLRVDRRLRTGHPAILAAGDCASPDIRSVSGALGDGARMAWTAHRLQVLGQDGQTGPTGQTGPGATS